jgi:CTD kinase subunit beta
MLESSGFDFRTRHPQKTLAKLAQHYKLSKESEVSDLAYRISLDLYRTFAPVKQTTPTMAFSCLELAGRLLDQRVDAVELGKDYDQWKTSRSEVMGKSPVLCNLAITNNSNRNPLRHPRTLHPPPLLNIRGTTVPSRPLPNRPHSPQPRSK